MVLWPVSWPEASTRGPEAPFQEQDVGNRWWDREKSERLGVCTPTSGDSWLIPSYLCGPPISKAMPILISTGKYASQRWARDTCVAI